MIVGNDQVVDIGHIFRAGTPPFLLKGLFTERNRWSRTKIPDFDKETFPLHLDQIGRTAEPNQQIF